MSPGPEKKHPVYVYSTSEDIMSTSGGGGGGGYHEYIGGIL